MNVLVYCPLSPVEPHIHPRTFASIMALEWDRPLTVVFDREDMAHKPCQATAYSNLTAKHNQARQMALDGDYDAVLFVEADMVIPRHTLKRLDAVNADVAYGLYVSRHKPHQWLAYSQLYGYDGISFSDIPEVDFWGRVIKSTGVGMGCTLVRREVLKSIEFRCPSPQVADDWYFALDVAGKGFTQKHDCGVVCGHVDGDTIYWPEPNGGFSIQVIDKELIYEQGQYA